MISADHPLAPIAAVLRDPNLPMHAKLAYLGLVIDGERRGGAWNRDQAPTEWLDVVETCGLSLGWARSGLKALDAVGLIRRTFRAGYIPDEGWELVAPAEEGGAR